MRRLRYYCKGRRPQCLQLSFQRADARAEFQLCAEQKARPCPEEETFYAESPGAKYSADDEKQDVYKSLSCFA